MCVQACKLDIMYRLNYYLPMSRRVLPKIINTKDLGGFRGTILTEIGINFSQSKFFVQIKLSKCQEEQELSIDIYMS